MAITCLGLNADGKFKLEDTLETHLATSLSDNLPYQPSGEEALKQGDYRDILSLTRVLICGPKSKEEVDIIIERYSILETSNYFFLLLHNL